jgi:hypothetical protein
MTTSRTTSLLTALIALALAVGVSAAVPAVASSTTKKDPRNDVFLDSVGGGIDLAAVQLKTLNRKQRIRVTFGLHSPALEVSLEKPGGLAAEFIKNKRIWRVVRVVREDGILRGEVCTYTRGEESTEPYNCSTLPVAQVDAKTYRTVVKLNQVKRDAEVLQWTASSMDLSNGTPVMDSLTANNGKPFRWWL